MCLYSAWNTCLTMRKVISLLSEQKFYLDILDLAIEKDYFAKRSDITKEVRYTTSPMSLKSDFRILE